MASRNDDPTRLGHAFARGANANLPVTRGELQEVANSLLTHVNLLILATARSMNPNNGEEKREELWRELHRISDLLRDKYGIGVGSDGGD